MTSLLNCCCNQIDFPIENKLDEMSIEQLQVLQKDKTTMEEFNFEVFKAQSKKNINDFKKKSDQDIKKNLCITDKEFLQQILDINIQTQSEIEAKTVLSEQKERDSDEQCQNTFTKISEMHLKVKLEEVIDRKEKEERARQKALQRQKRMSLLQFNEEIQEIGYKEDDYINKDLKDIDLFITEEDIMHQRNSSYVKQWLNLLYKFLIDAKVKVDIAQNEDYKQKVDLPLDSKFFKYQFEKTGYFLAKNALKHILIEIIAQTRANKANQLKLTWNNQINLTDNIQQNQIGAIVDDELRKGFILSQNAIIENDLKTAFVTMQDMNADQMSVVENHERKVTRSQSTQNSNLGKTLKQIIQSCSASPSGQRESAHDKEYVLGVRILQVVTENQLPSTPIVIEHVSAPYIEFVKEYFELNHAHTALYKKYNRLVNPDTLDSTRYSRRNLHESFAVRTVPLRSPRVNKEELKRANNSYDQDTTRRKGYRESLKSPLPKHHNTDDLIVGTSSQKGDTDRADSTNLDDTLTKYQSRASRSSKRNLLGFDN